MALRMAESLIKKCIDRLIRFYMRVRNHFHVLHINSRCQAEEDVTFTLESKIANPFKHSNITIGMQTLCMGELLLIAEAAQISIGSWCYVGPNTKIWSLASIKIGDRVFISHNVHIFDNNSHSLSAQERHDRFKELRLHGKHLVNENIKYQPVIIEDDVWIGFNVAILKGVTIGRGAIIGACTVVTHDIPPYTIFAGNPQRQIGVSHA